MSFKIFSLQLTGKIKPVATIEKQRKKLADDYEEFLKTENSQELKLLLELDELINSTEFTRNKKEVESLSFKGSKEEQLEKEFLKLKKSSAIRKYFKVSESADLVTFEKEKDGQKLNDYATLLSYMKDGEFAKEKKQVVSQVFNGSGEAKQLKELRGLEKSAAIRAYNQLNGSEQLKKYEYIAQSDKLKTFNDLRNSATIDKEKKKELKALKRDAEIKGYLKFEKSKKLKLHKEVAGSKKLDRYHELKEQCQTEEFKKQVAFLKDKKKFQKSEAFKKQNDFKTLAKDGVVKFVLKYEKSSLYKNYLNVSDSSDLKRYKELEEMLNSDELKERKNWLLDKKRWEKTEEFKQEQQHKTEMGKPEFILYYKYKDTADFDFLKNWELVFADDFKGQKLNSEKWNTTLPAAQKTLGENFAMPGDLNLFTNGENLKVNTGLCVQVKKEKVSGKLWQMPAGFVPTDFEYTSGMISTADKFTFETGILEAKIKFNPEKQVLSSLFVGDGTTMPRVNLLEMGKNNKLGVSKLNTSGKVESTGLDISNLKKGEYIFGLTKNGASVSWSINEVEVWQSNDNALNRPLPVNASSMVIEEIAASKLPLDFEVEWVKCYQKK